MGNRALSDATNRVLFNKAFQSDTFQNDAFQIYDALSYNLLTDPDGRNLSDDSDGFRVLHQSDEDAGYPYTYPITYDGEVDTRGLSDPEA